MTSDAMFAAANMLALAGLGWRCSLGWRCRSGRSGSPGWRCRLLLSVAYAGLVLAFWSRAPGGFGSLGEVMALFTMPEIALAGWIHYLAFDLFVGAWEVRTARREGIAFLLVLPCLVLTFLFGPAGFLVFTVLRAARATQRGVAEVRR